MKNSSMVAALRQEFPTLQQQVYGKPLRYLDNAATTLMPRVVLDALQDFEHHSRGNIARGTHYLANSATEAYEQARSQVGDLRTAARLARSQKLTSWGRLSSSALSDPRPR